MSYDDNVKIWKKAYSELKEVCEKYAVEFDNKYGLYDIRKALQEADNHLRAIELYEEHGIRLSELYYNPDHTNIDDYRGISFYDGERRNISWPDDGKQPKDVHLYQIGFSTGAYIFGRDYDSQQQVFKDFYEELKTYKPDYSDNHNHSLYWKLENAKPIHDKFNEILKKYHERNTSELKQRKADKLRKELAELEKDKS